MTQLNAQWVDSLGAPLASGQTVLAQWRFNLNDDAPVPSKVPVDNVRIQVVATNGQFLSLPDLCQTTGVAPVSSISTDRHTLICNVGAKEPGSSVLLETPIQVAGQTGSQISAAGTVTAGTSTVTSNAGVPGRVIQNGFGLDMLWTHPVYSQNYAYAGQRVLFQYGWALSKQRFGDAGPNSITYDLTLTPGNPSALTNLQAEGCQKIDSNISSVYRFVGAPVSDGSGTNNNNANFPTTCTLTQVSQTAYRLVITGLDYSETLRPTNDSNGQPLPAAQSVVASGRVVFSGIINASMGVSLQANAPSYTSSAGAVVGDNPANNTTSFFVHLPGLWSAQAGPRTSGSAWDLTFRKTAGESFWGATHYIFRNQDPNPPADRYSAVCQFIDTRYSTFTSAVPYFSASLAGLFRVQYAYKIFVDAFTGDVAADALRTRVCTEQVAQPNTVWTDVIPTDLNDVAAVRLVFKPKDMLDRGIDETNIVANQQLKTNLVSGQDVWILGAVSAELGTLTGFYNGQDVGPATTAPAGYRYPYTTGGRDVVTVVTATPTITSKLLSSSLLPGAPATLQLDFSGKNDYLGGTAIPTMQISSVLPAGISYRTGTAKLTAPNGTTSFLEPTITGSTLTWNLANLPANAGYRITFDVTTPATSSPGQSWNIDSTNTIAPASATAASTLLIQQSGLTTITKTTGWQYLVRNPAIDGEATGAWNISLKSEDPQPQAFTDVIDILPYPGDGRGTNYTGSYTITNVTAPAGATVYYTSANPATVPIDPAATANGAAGTIAGNTLGWTTTKPANVTAIRVIGGVLPAGETSTFTISIKTTGAKAGDKYVNLIAGRAAHTLLLMTSAADLIMPDSYAINLKKYVKDNQGTWRDANEPADYPTFSVGDQVTYRITITNAGSGTLTNIVITDDKYPTAGGFTIASLPAGQSHNHEYTTTLTATQQGSQIINTATGTVDTPPQVQNPPTIPDDPAGINITATRPITIKKIAVTGPLAGAEFQIHQDNNGTPGTVISDVFAASSPTGAPTTFTTKPLTVGKTYWLTETKAPTGYNLLATPVGFTITTTGIELINPTQHQAAILLDGHNLTVKDTTPLPLPTTGGTGPTPYAILGLTLITLGTATWNKRKTHT